MTNQSARAQIVERRTYLRPLNSQGTVFETPEQAWRRVIDHQRWLWERAQHRELDLVQEAELEELYSLFIDRKVTVSGRTRWLGGTEVAQRREASQFNPLPRDTSFITDSGVKSFRDVADGDTFTVLTHADNWKPAVARRAGQRDMVEIELSRGRHTTTIRSCVDHTWILSGMYPGERVTAKELKAGDKLYNAPSGDFYDWEYDSAEVDEQYYWAYGFVYGDGAVARSGNSETSRVRLCGNKEKYLDRFVSLGFGHSYPPSCDGDPFVYTGKYLKTLPEDDTELRLIKAFLHGYLDADGHKANRHGNIRHVKLFTASQESHNFVTTYAPVFGLYILGDEYLEVETNYGTRAGYNITFTTTANSGLLWNVKSVTPSYPEECWCLTVEDDHSFVLPNSIVSGNCAFGVVQTVHDVVDTIWLLLQGCGVGFSANIGVINGFVSPVELEIVRSKKSIAYDDSGMAISDPALKGNPDNVETFDKKTGVWKIVVGDSAEAWAKLFGKILAFKKHAKKLIIDFSEIRPAGYRLSGYGWISSGDAQIAKAVEGIVQIMNRATGKLLTAIDLLDIENHLGTILSSRRSAEIALYSHGEPEWREFAMAKKDHWSNGNAHRAMSNNSLLFYHTPSRAELEEIFEMMADAGGSEPGFINAIAALKRAPYFKGVNPCAEILLGDKSFCNLVEVAVQRFNGNWAGLLRAIYLVARANYRQTCVNLDDGILQRTWHELNEFLRLCGVGLTGIIAWEHHKSPARLELLRDNAHRGCDDMADELGLPRAKLKTTIKPSGCVPMDSIVVTDEGLLTMAEIGKEHTKLEEGDIGNISLGIPMHGNTLKGSGYYNNGFAEVYKIITTYNLPLYATIQHKWKTTSGHWVETGMLCAGDRLVVSVGEYKRDKSSSMQAVEKENYQSFPIIQPEYMDTDIAWLVGYTQGDGAMSEHKYRFRYCDANLDNLSKASRIFAEKFGIVVTPKPCEDRAAHQMEVGSKMLWDWFHVNGIEKQHIVPEKIRRSSTEDVIAYIAGLIDSDGHITEDGKVMFTQAADKFVESFQQTAWGVGLAFGRSLNNEGKNLQDTKHIWLCTLSAHTTENALDALWKHANKATGKTKPAWNRAFAVAVKDVEFYDIVSTADIRVDDEHRYLVAGAVESHNTQSKVFGLVGDEVPEGAHKPLAKYIFNRTRFPAADPFLNALKDAGYQIEVDPYSESDRLVVIPVEYPNVEFEKTTMKITKPKAVNPADYGWTVEKDFERLNPVMLSDDLWVATVEEEVEVEVNLESAVDQLDRYKLLQNHYVDHNCSITIYYSPDEVPDIISWLEENWDSYVGVSFLYRTDPTKTAADLGYPYLPQQPVDEQTFREYADSLREVNFAGTDCEIELDMDDCATGACPVR